MTALVSQGWGGKVSIPSNLHRQRVLGYPQSPWKCGEGDISHLRFLKFSRRYLTGSDACLKRTEYLNLIVLYSVYHFLMQEFSWSLAKWRYTALQFTYWFLYLFLNDDEHRWKSDLQTLRKCLCACRKQTNRAHCALPDMRSSVLLLEAVLDQLISM